MTTIAIDVGASGGIAVRTGDEIAAFAMPPTQGDVLELLAGIINASRADGGDVRAVVEKVGGYIGGRGGTGSAMFNFGQGYGFILGVLASQRVRVELVTPQKWQKGLSLGNSKSHASKTAWKNHLKARAQQLFPMQKVTLKIADALLILEYANRTGSQTP